MNETVRSIFEIMGIWMAAEIIIFTSVIFLVIRNNLLAPILNEDGTYRKRLSSRGKITALIMYIGVTVFPTAFDIWVIKGMEIPIPFHPLFLINLALLLLFFIWDTIVIDYLVLVKWRPGFLRISPKTCAQTMKKHILSSFKLQLIPIVLIAFLLSLIFNFL